MLWAFPDRLMQDIQTGANVCMSGQAGQLFGDAPLFGYLSKMPLLIARVAWEWSYCYSSPPIAALHGPEPLVALH